jgi:transcriptional regulator with XRE-family HTH domain
MPNTASQEEIYQSGFPKQVKRTKHDMVLNERLRIARQKKGFSLAHVSNMLRARGINTGATTIQGYEADENNINHRYPPVYMLYNLAKLYDVTVDYLFGFTNEPRKATDDIKEMLEKNQATFWNGKKMSQGQKELALEKINQITSL